MSTQRYIDTSFWDDAWVTELDPSEKLLYIYLLTNPLTNIAGVYKITKKRMCFDTGFNADTIGHILAKFETAKKVYINGEYIIVKNWAKNQKWESSEKIKTGIINILNQLPEDILYFLEEIEYSFDLKAVFDTLSIPYTSGTNYLNLNLNKDLNLNTDTEKKEAKKVRVFTPPSLDEVKAYIQEKNYSVDASKFHAYYDAMGWRDIKGNPVKNWKGKIVTWESRNKGPGTKPKMALDQSNNNSLSELQSLVVGGKK